MHTAPPFSTGAPSLPCRGQAPPAARRRLAYGLYKKFTLYFLFCHHFPGAIWYLILVRSREPVINRFLFFLPMPGGSCQVPPGPKIPKPDRFRLPSARAAFFLRVPPSERRLHPPAVQCPEWQSHPPHLVLPLSIRRSMRGGPFCSSPVMRLSHQSAEEADPYGLPFLSGSSGLSMAHPRI